MGTINWTVTAAVPKNSTVSSSGDSSSGAFTSGASAAAITNLSPTAGNIVTITPAQDTWIRFGGKTAAVGTGHFIGAATTRDFEVQQGDAGAVSSIEA